MASNGEHYALGWRDYGANFSNVFNQMLQDEELVDVTLAVDGHLFNAHRLVLSALSPYFRKMFKQMPANQQVFVFLKDVSKQTAEDLLTYIYSGEVNVASECLADFINVAKAFDIKGLTDDNYLQPREFSGRNPTCLNSALNGIQYQSTHINQHLASTSSLNRTKPAQFQSAESNYFQPAVDEYAGDEDFDYENTNEMTDQAYNMETGSDQKHEYWANGSGLMNQDDDASFGQWNGEFDSDSQIVQNAKNAKTPTAKRPKRNVDLSEYNQYADIRKNEKGRENLYFDNHKFYKQGKVNPKQRWCCTMEKSKKCRAIINTINIDDVHFMKAIRSEHTHD